jgi:epoxyqueuosine reductase QueG
LNGRASACLALKDLHRVRAVFTQAKNTGGIFFMDRGLCERAKHVALATGANLVGIVAVDSLPEHRDSIARILPPAKSVVVVAAKHSLAAIRSNNIQIAQFDTIHTCGEVGRAAQEVARYLEGEGFPSVAVPAFIPIDMSAPKKGMRGEICWRRAGTRAGLGTIGENGLLVTREFGASVRLSGVVTAADLQPDSPLDEDVCDHCRRCVEACPVAALGGKGKVNKRLCGDRIFEYGLRYFQRVVETAARGSLEEVNAMLQGDGLRELWQTFMSGNYYYCFRCQAQCPASELPRPDGW